MSSVFYAMKRLHKAVRLPQRNACENGNEKKQLFVFLCRTREENVCGIMQRLDK